MDENFFGDNISTLDAIRIGMFVQIMSGNMVAAAIAKERQEIAGFLEALANEHATIEDGMPMAMAYRDAADKVRSRG